MSAIKDHDLLRTKLDQLQAMLLMTHGEAQAPFDTLADQLRDNYMWACSTLVEECIALVSSPAIVSGEVS